MPRFFFHVYDDAVVLDDEGMELADVQAAERAALQGARAMICDQVMKGRVALRHRIEVEDEAGARVVTVSFGDAVRLES